MLVFKFGGASVRSAEAVRNVGRILELYKEEKPLVVVSAMGKSTNLLEKIVAAYCNEESYEQDLREFKDFHRLIVKDLLESKYMDYYEVENLFIELECLLDTEQGERTYDHMYDQIVSFGELISTRIISQYLNQHQVSNRWLDARNFIVTSSNHRRAKVNWEQTEGLINKQVTKLAQKQIVITQGFIGRSEEKHTTTLGREGSDYTAAIFAYGMGAESVTIWKDVPGVMNADPKRVSDTELLTDISFLEAIELAYYGASVIHPKTIQPLMRKKIPLYVKSFLNPTESGTTVQDHHLKSVIDVPCYIFKDNQLLINISTKDFSFIVEDNLSKIFDGFAKCGIQINLMQNTAISFSVCVSHDERRIKKLLDLIGDEFRLELTENLQLLTIFNYSSESDLAGLPQGGEKVLELRTGNALQILSRTN